ncbi:hypothetical protein HO133_005885 [Letharia lupina]|uniref:C2H2-type domain-containing protein n=1 Tax=Letharia lupina TaxID=560253 RepID=A0A8H6C8A8_9LECA|nr:uncharacterized protein HO133_005885 [Letharia lupina]KAF6218536.1 hypothetical protein HO133_005885 [Letharia lupina]
MDTAMFSSSHRRGTTLFSAPVKIRLRPLEYSLSFRISDRKPHRFASPYQSIQDVHASPYLEPFPYKLIHTKLRHSFSTRSTYYQFVPTIQKTFIIVTRFRLHYIYIMCYSCGSASDHPNFAYSSGPPSYQHQQQTTRGYQYPHGNQNLRPPPLNTSYSCYSMNRTSSHGSSDSGYVTSHVPSRQLSQQSPSYSYDNQRSPDIEVVHAAPVSSSRHKKERRLSCGHISSRAHDLKRHMTVHFPPAPDELLDCQYEWCGRTGAHGFKREDHRKEHYRKVHMKESEYPKTGKGGRSGRSSGKSKP